MVKHRLRRSVIGIVSLWAWMSGTAAYAESETLYQVGDTLQWAIPVGAGFIAAGKLDGEGLGQLVEGALWTSVTTHVLKVEINATRPNGHDYSMPSAHTSGAAQGAAFLQFRYGWRYGVPAYMLTGLVGYSRVDNNYHYWRDVVAGAALATTIQYLITEQGVSVQNLAITPVISDEQFGVYASMKF
ncbi:phosphatase PAP2 family protein [Vibrio zhugei]|uniref:Phosphatase PAP2 family protein n=1 Tax=Vibrio zhugei TaxID=2479546 RepID=A0ABV7C2M0_9VIBR|nr:phosphatase PAP2 family protein [Vibrio zhugei]